HFTESGETPMSKTKREPRMGTALQGQMRGGGIRRSMATATQDRRNKKKTKRVKLSAKPPELEGLKAAKELVENEVAALNVAIEAPAGMPVKKRGRKEKPKEDKLKQITVRLKPQTHDFTLNLAKAKSISITDAFEQALWAWLRSAQDDAYLPSALTEN